jgi:hypothetical protein
LRAILAIAKAARDEAPWDRRTHRYHEVVFPQMAGWLPEDEAEQLCFEFARELERIEALLAAWPSRLRAFVPSCLCAFA